VELPALPHRARSTGCPPCVPIAGRPLGKLILCEKSIADTLGAIDRMTAAAEKASVTLIIAENLRCSPLYHKIRELLDRGAIGKTIPVQRARECRLTHRGQEPHTSFWGGHPELAHQVTPDVDHEFIPNRCMPYAP